MQRKQQLLKKHRQKKRLSLLFVLLALAAVSLLLHWYLLPLGLVFLWVTHEAWFSDHLFYSAKEDYCYQFPAQAPSWEVFLESKAKNKKWLKQSQITLPLKHDTDNNTTYILKISLKTNILAYFFDPYIDIGDDRQYFERGAQGVRYLNLTGQDESVSLTGHFCKIAQSGTLYAFKHSHFAQQKIMVLAPHADDAELACFGLYSQAKQVSIITLTQGEIKAYNYQKRYGLSPAQAARLKGRLRAYDSQAIPLWAGIKQNRCVQLGYYCMQLLKMAEKPTQAFTSLETQESDIRSVRRLNAFALPSDKDGSPSWQNLIADLSTCLQHFQPDVVVVPHPDIDPHPDHIATNNAFFEAVKSCDWQPESVLFYANHLADNDRWPMGSAHQGVALPPLLVNAPAYNIYSHVLSVETQIDKSLALAMQHDLQAPLPLKRYLRRIIQHLLLGRRWPDLAANEYQRKAVRRHEIFWYKKLSTAEVNKTNHKMPTI